MSIEYTIYCIYNGGKPFSLNTYNNINDVKLHLYDMISLEERRHRPYYVYNSFFKNKYPSTITGKFFCIKKREVSEWEIYDENEKQCFQNNNIVYFKNFENIY